MATVIRIGHASWSENKTAYGIAGDSTGYEVCINPDFNIESLQPNIVLRPKTASLANSSANACEAGCLNNNIGYSQSGRNTLYNLAKAKNYNLASIDTKCNTDCSAFMTVCAIAGGARIDYSSNGPTTTNMRTRFKQSGDYTVLTDSKHLTQTDYLKRGDILVCEGNHTVMVLDNGKHYKDELIEEPESAVTPVRTICTYILDLEMTNIKSTSATAKIKVLERVNNIEKTISNATKWTYSLELKLLPELTTMTYNFNKTDLSLTGLIAGRSYIARVVAKVTGGDIAFCSANTIFSTEPQKASDNKKPVDLGLKVEDGFIDKIYIKDKNDFKQAILYKNMQGD
jgi:hypothetical protein